MQRNWISPFHKTLCPFCFSSFHPSICPLRQEHCEPADKVRDEVLCAFLGVRELDAEPFIEQTTLPLWQRLVNRIYMDNAVLRTHDRICPSCHLPIPTRSAKGESQSKLIATIGETESGKSNYIGVLAHQLCNNPLFVKAGFTAAAQVSFDAAEGRKKLSSDLWEDRYGAFLYPDNPAERCVVPPTGDWATNPAIRTPLIYQIVSSSERDSELAYRLRKCIDMVFYDTAGEDIERRERLHLWRPYVSESQGIVFIVDPARFDAVREDLQTRYPQNMGLTKKARSHSILDFIIENADRTAKSGEKSIGVPIAIVLAKSDLLDPVVSLDLLARNSTELPQAKGIDMNRIRSNSALLEEWLVDIGQGAFVKKCKFFKKYSFFAASSLGEQPAGDGRIGNFSPRRVLDPILWMLYQQGMMGDIANA